MGQTHWGYGMRKRVGSLAGLLVLALGSGTVAQSPSPDPPPWFGGRVEMPEHGFAVTLPDDWVAFDTSADAVSQVGAASGFVDLTGWVEDEAGLVGLLEDTPAELLVGSGGGTSVCGLGALYRGPVVSADDSEGFATHMYDTFVDAPQAYDVELPQPVDLPGGPAYLMRWSEGELRLPSSMYLRVMDGLAFAMWCGTEDARPDDDWLSIAETFEFLPVEE